MMSSELTAGIIGAGGALLGSVVGAAGSYYAARIGYDHRKLKKQLIDSLHDIQVFHLLETEYSARLAGKGSPEAVRNEFRQAIRTAHKVELSESSQPAKVRVRLSRLGEGDD